VFCYSSFRTRVITIQKNTGLDESDVGAGFSAMASPNCEAHETVSKKPHAQITVSMERPATIAAKPHFVLMISPNPGRKMLTGKQSFVAPA
jgi:hypothetical protein